MGYVEEAASSSDEEDDCTVLAARRASSLAGTSSSVWGPPAPAAAPDLDAPPAAAPPYQGTGRVLVCTGSKCRAMGGGEVFEAAAAIAADSPGVAVMPCKCLGKCSAGAAMRVKVEGVARCAVLTRVAAGEVRAILDDAFLQPPPPPQPAAAEAVGMGGGSEPGGSGAAGPGGRHAHGAGASGHDRPPRSLEEVLAALPAEAAHADAAAGDSCCVGCSLDHV